MTKRGAVVGAAMNDVCIYVFSYNRGKFLLNCLRSIEACAPGIRVCILDDNSTDNYTKSVLGNLAQHYAVVENTNETHAEIKTGGLSGAMNIAMMMAKKECVKLAVFIQDDMQFVRRLDDGEIKSYYSYFDSVPNSMQISTAFIRELSGDTFHEDYDTSKNAHAYIRLEARERGKSSFSASGVFSVDRFHDLFHNFDVGEGANSAKARSLGLVCGRAIYPNMCWLPYPLSYRGKKKTFKHNVFEKLGRSGFYPIDLMTPEQEAAFLARDRNIPPIMERFLFAPNAPRHDIWSTGGGEYNFVCYGGLSSKLFIGARVAKSWLIRRKL